MPCPAEHELPPHQHGTSWWYEYDFRQLGANFLEGVTGARFIVRRGSETGPIVMDLTLGSGITISGTVLRLEPDEFVSFGPGNYRHGLRLDWAGPPKPVRSDPIEGPWRIKGSIQPDPVTP